MPTRAGCWDQCAGGFPHGEAVALLHSVSTDAGQLSPSPEAIHTGSPESPSRRPAGSWLGS